VLARVAGVPVVLSASWVLAAMFLCAVYAPVLRDAVPSIGRSTAYASSLCFAVLFGLCVLAHEAGHTLVSIRLGYPVRRIVLFALGGASEIEDEPSRPRDELLIAASGPLVSVAIAAGAWFAYDAAPPGRLLTALLGLLFWGNAGLAAFNLLPGLPLDGGRIVQAILAALGAGRLAASRVVGWTGRGIAVALVTLGFALDHSAAGLAGGVFTAAIAAYLWFAAGQAMAQARLLARVPRLRTRELVRPGLLVPADVTVAEALERAWQSEVGGLVLVDSADRPTAIVDEARIGAVPAERRRWTPVTAVARPLVGGLTLPEHLEGAELLARVRATPASEYLVVDGSGRAVGVIATKDLVHRLRGSV
jgi:Zn-dependent protease/CBS domain-containing protein